MSSLDLLISYFSSTPFPAVLYRSSPASSSTSAFELDQLPTYLNKEAEGYIGHLPFAASVAPISQEVLEDGLSRSRQRFWASRKGKEKASKLHDGRTGASASRGSDGREVGSSVSEEITLLHRVPMPQTPFPSSSMEVDDERTGQHGGSTGNPPISPTEVPSDKDNPSRTAHIPGKGNLQLCRWHLSILDDPEDQTGTRSILCLTGKWISNSTTEIDRSRSQSRNESEDTSPRPGPSPLPGTRNEESDISMNLDLDVKTPVMDASIPSELRKRAADLKIKFPQPLPSGVKPPEGGESRRPSSYFDPGDVAEQTEDAQAQAHSCFPASAGRANGESSHSFYTTADSPMGTEPLQLNPLILARLAENAPIGMVIATTSAKLIWVNDMWYSLTGLKRGEPLDSWIERVAPEYMPLMLQTVADLMDTRAVSNVDFMWKDGTWANFTTQCDFDEDGCFVGLIGTLTDATRRKRAELNEIANLKMVAEETERRSHELAEAHKKNQKLQQQRNMLASVAEISPTGLTIANRAGKLLWANRAFLSMYGLTEANMDEWGDCTHEDDVKGLIESLVM
jgi:PAS domain-containing protein